MAVSSGVRIHTGLLTSTIPPIAHLWARLRFPVERKQTEGNDIASIAVLYIIAIFYVIQFNFKSCRYIIHLSHWMKRFEFEPTVLQCQITWGGADDTTFRHRAGCGKVTSSPWPRATCSSGNPLPEARESEQQSNAGFGRECVRGFVGLCFVLVLVFVSLMRHMFFVFKQSGIAHVGACQNAIVMCCWVLILV